MQEQNIIFAIFLIFTGAAVLAGLALYARQSLLVAYVVLGGLLGPWGFKLVTESGTIQEIGHIGIIFLLFLLGLNLHPQKLVKMLREATKVTVLSSLVFAVLGWIVALVFGFTGWDGVLIGAMMMFSSTIIGLKLLPTTELHHRRMGEMIISILLLQDILAILILMVLQSLERKGLPWTHIGLFVLALPMIAIVSLFFARYILISLIRRYDTIREYIFLMAIGWCLGIAQLADFAGLSYEMGAFIAGVALAAAPIATYIAESLKPLRDFFLVLFLFSLGASFELPLFPEVALPAIVLAGVMVLIKPVVFKYLFARAGEAKKFSSEIGLRLGQTSEFSLLIAMLAVQSNVISHHVSYVIQAATLITFVISSYIIMLRLPTPIAVDERLRRD